MWTVDYGNLLNLKAHGHSTKYDVSRGETPAAALPQEQICRLADALCESFVCMDVPGKAMGTASGHGQVQACNLGLAFRSSGAPARENSPITGLSPPVAMYAASRDACGHRQSSRATDIARLCAAVCVAGYAALFGISDSTRTPQTMLYARLEARGLHAPAGLTCTIGTGRARP